MVDGLVEKFGEFKKTVDGEKRGAYKVPTTRSWSGDYGVRI